jgi:hypothetical protein
MKYASADFILTQRLQKTQRALKSEARNPKFETKGNVPNSNDKNSKARMLVARKMIAQKDKAQGPQD